ncbi:hypothetical protein NA8A_17348 [Nitratireductor indicus C115]|uniref:AB hydrolase-1 domain-containing protein n=1 Tax=Nitratireductor indicus C115 TaxID=1231190 RepID=K2P1N3_9HYPH|nr:alpha/beta hydrolase [Nitratireductor indicus]EKF41281.1 hypothetical protein NA8A_17348 [Nitratireductor indicus C115]SFQ65437.1 Pimeloyl-ACP methyl ester carboxylesterase [Nitratireductor indicus]
MDIATASSPLESSSTDGMRVEDRLTDVGGYRMRSLLIEARENADLPPVLFIHGASTSLLDPLNAFREPLEGRASLFFVDRPGHGGSQAGPAENRRPDGQAHAIARLMDERGIGRAIVVGHSYGGAVAAALALEHPEKLRGLLLLSPVLYPWPGGIAWYYTASAMPVFGWLFTRLVVPLAGRLAMESAARSVFSPDPLPAGYIEKSRAIEAIQPAAFRHNAREIASLLDWTKENARRYAKIAANTIIVTGDTDDVVSPDIHSRQMAQAVPNAELIVIPGLGHKPDYCATDMVIASIEALARMPEHKPPLE